MSLGSFCRGRAKSPWNTYETNSTHFLLGFIHVQLGPNVHSTSFLSTFHSFFLFCFKLYQQESTTDTQTSWSYLGEHRFEYISMATSTFAGYKRALPSMFQRGCILHTYQNSQSNMSNFFLYSDRNNQSNMIFN